MSDLFPNDEAQAPKDERIDWYNAFAVEKLGMPPRWRWFKLEVKNYGKPSTFVAVTGAVCDAKIEKGKRKGSDNWKLRDKSTEAELPVRDAEMDAFKLDWERRTGKCHRCQGRGKVVWSVSVSEGTKYRDCERCHGAGLATKVEVAA